MFSGRKKKKTSRGKEYILMARLHVEVSEMKFYVLCRYITYTHNLRRLGHMKWQ